MDTAVLAVPVMGQLQRICLQVHAGHITAGVELVLGPTGQAFSAELPCTDTTSAPLVATNGLPICMPSNCTWIAAVLAVPVMGQLQRICLQVHAGHITAGVELVFGPTGQAFSAELPCTDSIRPDRPRMNC